MTVKRKVTILARRLPLPRNSTLLVIIAVALILRVISALYHGNTVDVLPGIHDQVSYHGLAERVIAGYGFSFGENHWPITPADAPTAHWSFLYTLFLASIYWLAGVNPLSVRLIQVFIVSVAHSYLTYRLGKQLFGKTTGLCAALLSAAYIYFIYYAGALMTEPFYIIGILWVLDAAIRIVLGTKDIDAQDGNQHEMRIALLQWAELGLAIGFTMLMRQVFGLFVPFLFLWLWWELSGKARRNNGTVDKRSFRLAPYYPALWGMLITSTVALLMIAPWTMRNYQAFGQFVPLNTNSGYAFFWGNHPIYGTNFVGILPPDGPTYQELIPEELRSLNEAELDKELLRIGLGFVTSEPRRYALLSLSRFREYFKFWPSVESSLISNFARVGSFGIMLPFMLYGLWATARTWLASRPLRSSQQGKIWGAGIVLLSMFMLFYTSIHLLTWALIRYRLPVDAILLIFAGYGITQLVHRWELEQWLPSWATYVRLNDLNAKTPTRILR